MTHEDLLEIVGEVFDEHLARLMPAERARLRHLTAESVAQRVLAAIRVRQALLRSSPPNGTGPPT